VLTFDLLKEQREVGKVGSDDEDGRELEDGSVCSGGNGNNQSLLNRQSNKQAGLTKSNKRTSSSTTDSKNDKQHGHTQNLDSEITSSKLILLSLTLLLTLHISTVLWIDYIGGTSIGAIFTFYILVLFGILLPIQSTSWIRIALTTIFHRAFELIHPRCFCLQGLNVMPRAVPFVDVFFADAMCSLSKVFFDWGMLWHLAWHYPQPVPMDLHSIAIPSIAASLPYLCRARQCIIMHTIGRMKSDPKRYQHMLNAIKYSTSLWPLLISAYQKVVSTEEEKLMLERVLIVLLAINSTYSLAWDIIMDWGMMQDPSAIAPAVCVAGGGVVPGGSSSSSSSSNQSCAHSVLRPRLRFGAATSISILLIDMILRYSWMLRFWEKDLFPSTDVYILITQFLEAIRRSLWNLLRVEWENIKQNRGKESSEKSSLEMTGSGETDPFLLDPVSSMRR